MRDICSMECTQCSHMSHIYIYALHVHCLSMLGFTLQNWPRFDGKHKHILRQMYYKQVVVLLCICCIWWTMYVVYVASQGVLLSLPHILHRPDGLAGVDIVICVQLCSTHGYPSSLYREGECICNYARRLPQHSMTRQSWYQWMNATASHTFHYRCGDVAVVWAYIPNIVEWRGRKADEQQPTVNHVKKELTCLDYCRVFDDKSSIVSVCIIGM